MAIAIAAGLASGCASGPEGARLHGRADTAATGAPPEALPEALPPAAAEAAALLLGEQHDAALHHQWHARTVAALAARGRLAALALEMAEQGTGTVGLAPSADEAAVRAALRWDEAAWPWASYGPAVMAAVRAGVPALGANLPRERMRAAMAEAALDALLPPAALERQREAIRSGHCGLLPASQIGPMTRIQVARDRAMAQVVADAVRPGQTVVLLAGGGHVDEAVGVPLLLRPALPAGTAVAAVQWPAQPPAKDYCAELRRQMRPATGATAASPATPAAAPVTAPAEAPAR